jgi:cytosine/adenosine deaminase-related metal-dependent hydrolase
MLILNATVLRAQDSFRLVPGQGIYIAGERIREIGPYLEIEQAHPRTRKIDAGGNLVLPGLICAHTHLYRTLAVGLQQPEVTSVAKSHSNREFWRRFAASLHAEDIHWSALLGLIDAIRHGTTLLFDHHSSPAMVDGSLDILASAIAEAGLRGALCYGVADTDTPGGADSGIRENVRFLRRCAQTPSSTTAAMFGLEDSTSLSGATLQACRAAAPDGAGFHVHVAEFAADQDDSLSKTGMGIVHRLRNHEILGPSTIAAHCVHIDIAEGAALADTGTSVAHLPRSNMWTGTGVAPIEGLFGAKVRVCLGDDGLPGGMWNESQAAYLVHKGSGMDTRRAAARQIISMTLDNGAALARDFFPEQGIGFLEPGAVADLVVIRNTAQPFADPDNLAESWVWDMPASSVLTTVVAGKVIMQDGKLLTLDESEIRHRAREHAARVWKRCEERSSQ